MLEQGSGGAYEVSSRFTAMVGWGAVNGVDDFVWDGASEKYALDDRGQGSQRQGEGTGAELVELGLGFSKGRCSHQRSRSRGSGFSRRALRAATKRAPTAPSITR